MKSTFIANIAIMPATPGEALPTDLRRYLTRCTVTVDREDYIELTMASETYPRWRWMQGLSARFPGLRIAMRGDNMVIQAVSYGFVSGGQVIRKRSESGQTLAGMNLRAMLFPDWGFTQDIDDYGVTLDTAVSSPFSNPTLLWQLENFFDLTDEQRVRLEENPKYSSDFEPQLDWWLQHFRSC